MSDRTAAASQRAGSLGEKRIPKETQLVAGALARAKSAAGDWAATALSERLKIVRRARRLIAAEATDLAVLTGRPRMTAEGLVSEVLPLADAARFLEREAPRLLRPRRLGRLGRPAWLPGVTAEVHREPCGVVLLLCPKNYPLFLPGVQLMQALVAGNTVVAKPAEGCADVLRALADLLRRAGLPEDVLMLLPDDAATGKAASAAAFDKIILTGSAKTGVEVLRAASANITPCTMELSGDDPVFVLPGANVALAACAISYGLSLNSGETCIAPRRILAWEPIAGPLRDALTAINSGFELPELIPVRDTDEACGIAASSPFSLGATIFGPQHAAAELAKRVSAGCVVINDMIVPTADPRVPFGGRKHSGFGVTRGAEGLLELTVVKTICVRRGGFRPHLLPIEANDARLFANLIMLLHGPRLSGIAAIGRLIRGLRQRSSSMRRP
jgi:acyl-CoA reductase-like NAD-dependent aldehyde dehydrogenase